MQGLKVAPSSPVNLSVGGRRVVGGVDLHHSQLVPVHKQNGTLVVVSAVVRAGKDGSALVAKVEPKPIRRHLVRSDHVRQAVSLQESVNERQLQLVNVS